MLIEFHTVNQAKIHDVHWNLGIVATLQRTHDILFRDWH
jgi:hypothetical protein